MGIKRWLHSKIVRHLTFECSCDQCGWAWIVWEPVSGALASLRRHAIDWHGGVDLSD